MNNRRRLLRSSLVMISAALAVLTLHGCVRLSRSVALAKSSEPFSQRPTGQICARVLVAGDSTAVGTGAASPGASIAGRIGAAFPDARIVNVGEDGALVQEIAAQIEAADTGRFDLVLIQAGGNDVLRFTPLDQLTAQWQRTLDAAQRRAGTVAVMHAGNVGTAPIFFPPLSWIYSSRAEQAHQRARRVVQTAGATFVDLFYPRDEDPFLADPQHYYAADGLHPSAAGYGLWFDTLQRSGVLKQALAPDARACARPASGIPQAG